MADMLAMVKTALRQTTTRFDELELTPLIEAAKLDLYSGGVDDINEENPLIQRAIILYCKAYFGFTEESERFERAYIALKNTLGSSSINTITGGGGDVEGNNPDSEGHENK